VKNKGLTISKLEDLPEMQKKVAPVLEQWSAKSPLVGEFIKLAQST
jgi:TRAP-type transport system periplasmic protein